jgi:hypothetical protein
MYADGRKFPELCGFSRQTVGLALLAAAARSGNGNAG